MLDCSGVEQPRGGATSTLGMAENIQNFESHQDKGKHIVEQVSRKKNQTEIKAIYKRSLVIFNHFVIYPGFIPMMK